MSAQSTSADPVIVASADTHVSPPLSALRPYCEKALLDEYDAYTKHFLETMDGPTGDGTRFSFRPSEDGNDGDAPAMPQLTEEQAALFAIMLEAQSIDYGDVKVRLDHLNHERTACEVVFHGTGQRDPENGKFASWPIPWSLSERSLVAGTDSTQSAELVNAGRRIYNRWLADLCSVEPERHAGLAHVPIWDIDAAIEEVKWAKENGLKGINFPAPGSPFPAFDGPTEFKLTADMPPYESDVWDPFFAVCADLNMPLTTHVGHPILPPYYTGPGSFAIVVFEQMPLSGRNLWHLIFSGVFDRHPNLKFVITEVLGPWVGYVVDNMDSVYKSTQVGPGMMLRTAIKKSPGEYVKNNVYFGCSFMSRPEALLAVERDLTDRIFWGSDWPHPEGTFHHDSSLPPLTPISLANTFHGLPEKDVRAMVGGNLIDCYDLDAPALQNVADRIGPSIDDLLTAPDLSLVPNDYVGQGFRNEGLMFT
jgi:predicted TIM-barrel fold metal-dependent hydrolase